MRIVLDTNCLIQSVSPHSAYYAVWKSFMNDENTLCVTNDIIEEYVEILQRLFGFRFAENVVKTIVNSPFVEFVTPYYQFHVIEADPDDNKFVDCAIAAVARYIVSNDHHFDVLRHTVYPIVDVIVLDDFLKLLQQQNTVN